MSDPDPRLIKRLNILASGSAVFAVLVGLVGLAGWKLHSVTLDTWGAPPVRIVPNTAAGCILLGAALWLLRKPQGQSFGWPRKLAARAAAGIVCLMGLLVLAEHIFGWDFSIDQLLVTVPFAERIPGLRPGLVSSSAACDFILLSSALLLLDWKTRREKWPAQHLSFGAAIIAVFGFFALLLEPRASGLTMAFPAGVAFFVLACGLLGLRPTWAVGGLLVSHRAGARLLRRASPSALLVLGLICWSISKAMLTEAHFTWVETSLLAIACGTMLVGFITWIAFIVDRSDAVNERLERRVAERTAALAASEGRLAGIIQSAMDAIITVDEEQKIVVFNAAAEWMFRCPANEALGQPLDRFIPQRFRNKHRGHIRRFGESGVTSPTCPLGERRGLRGDGEEFPIDASISQTGAGGKKLFTVILRDVSERKRAEEALRESEHRYRVLFSEMVVGFALLEVIYDENGKPCDHRYLEVNPAFETQSGLPREKVLRKTIREVLPSLDPFWIETYGKVATTGESVHFENYAQPIDRWLEVTAFRTHQGQVGVTFADVTERKRAEERLAVQAEELSHQAEELARSRQALETERLMLQSVLDSIGEGLVAADKQGKFVLWNPAAEKILGQGATNVPPDKWAEHYRLYLSDTVTPFPTDQLPLVRAIRGEASITEQFVHNPELDQGVWIEVTGGPLKDKNGTLRGGVVAIRDITQRKADEQKIRSLNEELEEKVVQRTAQLEFANRELEAFTYSVSHDLRAPLRHIGGFSRILVEDFGPGLAPEARQHLQRIEDGVRRMGLLVDELLNLARVGRHAVRLQATGLNSIIEEVLSLLQPETAGRVVTWKVAELPSARCDPILIMQVFQNLLANALKFTRPRERAVIEISYRQENGELIIAVRDNGVGFNMKYIDKLFGVFQRLHRAEDFEGTGIGLVTVQRIVHKHGGRIWAESEVDKGATFCFTLAAESAAVKPAALKAAGCEAELKDATTPTESREKSAVAGA